MDLYQLIRRLDTARNCIHLSAEELQICWDDNSTYWEMVPNHGTESRNKIARLKVVNWFDVKGEVVCSLRPGTYTVSWRACLSADARGWESDAVTFTFSKEQQGTEDISRCKCYLKRPGSGVVLTQPEPTIRDVGNGWTEYEVGEFAVEAGEEIVALQFAMVATSDVVSKTGLSLDGVVIRPKSLVDVTAPGRLESSSAGVSDAAGSPSNNSMDTNQLLGRFALPSSEVAALAVEATDGNRVASISTTQYYSARTQWMIENRDKFARQVDFEMECSKVHRTSVQRGRSSVEEDEGSGGDEDTDEDEDKEEDEEILEANRTTITELRKDLVWQDRFLEDRDGVYELREKIGQGGEAQIYAGIRTDLEEGSMDRHVVFKVFERGFYLQDLVKLSPDSSPTIDLQACTSFICKHVMLLPNDGRIAMVMPRAWGDLRRYIDLKKQANNNQGPPFDVVTVVMFLLEIAWAMYIFHHINVVHRDLKASNILVQAFEDNRTAWESNVADIELPSPEEHGYRKFVHVADLECALGVMGTGFWRAPEVLLGLRDRSKKRYPMTLFTKASDVYSYGMLCYEVATGFLPFEREGYIGTKAEQDHVISGARPTFPNDVDCRVKDLIMRCWLDDDSQRPTFEEIYGELGHIMLQIHAANGP